MSEGNEVTIRSEEKSSALATRDADGRTMQFVDTLEERWRMAKMMVQSGMLPRAVNSPEKAMTIMLKGHELGLPPMVAMSSINVIQGTPTLAGQLMLALCKRDANATIEVHEKSRERCSITLTRGDTGESIPEEFTIEDAANAGLTGKDNWQNWPSQMLYWRAVSNACRNLCPDVVAGMYTPEEVAPEAEVDPQTGALVEPDAPLHTRGAEPPKKEKKGGPGKLADALGVNGDGEKGVETTTDRDTGGDGLTTPETGAAEAPEPAGEDFEGETDACPLCTKEFPAGKSLGAHVGAHTKEGYDLPDGFRVVKAEGNGEYGEGFLVEDADGERHGHKPDNLPFERWERAVAQAHRIAPDSEDGGDAEPEDGDDLLSELSQYGRRQVVDAAEKLFGGAEDVPRRGSGLVDVEKLSSDQHERLLEELQEGVPV